MQDIKALVIGDVHICDHAPGKRVEGYRENILAKLYECVKIAKDNACTHVIFLGDIFHIKVPNRVSHSIVQDMADVFLAFDLPVFVLVGNHDITHGTLDTLPKQPLGTLAYIPEVTLLTDEPYQLDDDVTLYPIAGTSDITIDNFEIQGDNKRDIMLVHQSVVPDIGTEPEVIQHILFDSKLVAERTNIDIVLYGHQHRYDGIYERQREDGSTATFSNLGSICRLTIGDGDIDKEPAVMLLTIAADENRTTDMEIIKLNEVLPSHEVYHLDEHLEQKEHSKDIDETIKKLQATEVSAFSIDGVIDEVETRTDIDDRVKTTALDLLEEVR